MGRSEEVVTLEDELAAFLEQSDCIADFPGHGCRRRPDGMCYKCVLAFVEKKVAAERKRCVSLAGCMAKQPLIDAIKSGEELT